MMTRPPLWRLTASAKNASASPEIAVAGYSLIKSSVTGCAAATAGKANTRTTAATRARERSIRVFRTMSGVGGAQCAVEVVVEIARILQADREAQQVSWAGRARPLDRGAVLDQALDTAERSGALPQLDARGGRDRGLLAGLHA